MPAGVYTNEIPHQHKAIFLSDQQIERRDESLNWAFRRAKGQATEADTELVMEMRGLAQDPQRWEALGFPEKKREEALAACNTWLDGIGDRHIVHGERE